MRVTAAGLPLLSQVGDAQRAGVVAPEAPMVVAQTQAGRSNRIKSALNK